MSGTLCQKGVAGFWKVFYIGNSCFVLDTLRVANRSPTPASKINDFLGLFDDIWGSGAAFPGLFGGFRGSGPELTQIFLIASKSQPRRAGGI